MIGFPSNLTIHLALQEQDLRKSSIFRPRWFMASVAVV
jgi:hypothetical protein